MHETAFATAASGKRFENDFFCFSTISDMERIGDQAQDIADISRFVKVQEIAHKMNIGKMAEATI